MTIHHGDCLDVMAAMEPESVDAIVCDPPYDLTSTGGRKGSPRRNPGSGPYGRQERGFMGKAWDGTGIAFDQRTWELALRVAKPSAYLLAFGGTRTVHRLATAIEDAGWIIRDLLVWAYASGFPKSKASLKPAWEPIVMARKPGPLRMLAIDECRIVSGPTARIDAWADAPNLCASCAVDADSPARPGAPGTGGSTTPRRAGQRPNGSGTRGDISRAGTGCSHGMTPGSGASSSSIVESGRTPTGLSPMDTSSTTSTRTSSTTASRTCTCCGGPITPTTTSGTRSATETEPRAGTTSASIGSVGRWPSNVLLTDPIFDGDAEGVVGGGKTGRMPGTYERGTVVANHVLGASNDRPIQVGHGDTGTYSRFFLIPKADRADREPVLGGLPLQWPQGWSSGEQSPGTFQSQPTPARANVHPTVKPTELMRHLVRLMTPPGGTVLDPFLGSGTTALAAEMEGFAWIGIEREAEYVAIAEARLNGTQRGLGLEVPA